MPSINNLLNIKISYSFSHYHFFFTFVSLVSSKTSKICCGMTSSNIESENSKIHATFELNSSSTMDLGLRTPLSC